MSNIAVFLLLVAMAAIAWSIKIMSDAFNRLSASVDAAVAKLTEPLPPAGTSDADLNTLADKLDNAVAQGPSPTV